MWCSSIFWATLKIFWEIYEIKKLRNWEIFSISFVQKTKDQGEVLGNVMFLNFLSNFENFKIKKLEIFSISLVQKTKDQREALGNVMFLNFLSNFENFLRNLWNQKIAKLLNIFYLFGLKNIVPGGGLMKSELP